jgi:hypothetical protein
MRPSKLILVVALASAAAVACSSTGPVAADGETRSTVPSSRSVEPSAGVPEVLDFSAPSLGGGTVNGSDYVGKDVAIWFWAPW